MLRSKCYILHRVSNHIPATKGLGDVASYLSAVLQTDIQPELEDSARVPIVIDAHTYQNVPDRPFILFNTEQLLSDSTQLTPWYRDQLRRSSASKQCILLMDYSRTNLDSLKWTDSLLKIWMPVGFLPEWDSHAASLVYPMARDIEVLHFGALNPRRINVIERLQRRGVRVAHADNLYGPDRDEALLRAKVVLNVHYYPCAMFEPFRCVYAKHFGCEIVSEQSINFSSKDTPWLHEASYDTLDQKVLDVLEGRAELENSVTAFVDSRIHDGGANIRNQLLEVFR